MTPSENENVQGNTESLHIMSLASDLNTYPQGAQIELEINLKYLYQFGIHQRDNHLFIEV